MSNIIWEQEILEPNAPIGGVVIKRLGYPNYVTQEEGRLAVY